MTDGQITRQKHDSQMAGLRQIIIIKKADKRVLGLLRNFLYKIDKKTYIGNINGRVRQRIIEDILLKWDADATIIYADQNEQGFSAINTKTTLFHQYHGKLLMEH